MFLSIYRIKYFFIAKIGVSFLKKIKKGIYIFFGICYYKASGRRRYEARYRTKNNYENCHGFKWRYS